MSVTTARFLALSAAVVAAHAAKKKNILFMIEDDGSMDSSIYGNKKIQTPGLERLAKMGTVFDNFHTTVSSCSPSRAALMAGLPSHQNGMYGLQHALEHFQSFDGVQSMTTVLNGGGYTSGIQGKYHVWPAQVYNFSWGNNPDGPGGCQAGASSACPNTNYNLVARNITYMRDNAARFLDYAEAQDTPFFLYIGFGDSHRCATGGAGGEFCQYYGYDNATQKSTIPDWTPHWYDPADVQVPYWVQDTPIARQDLAFMYTAKNRMDQGVGLMLDLLQERGLLNDTLVIFTADNGAPWAEGKTHQYQVATIEPCIVYVPGQTGGTRSEALASTLDLLPTWLDWAGLAMPDYTLNGQKVQYFSQSLLPLVEQQLSAADAEPHPLVTSLADMRARYYAPHRAGDPLPLPSNYSKIYGSHQFHEVQMYNPMRSVTAAGNNGARYHLIYNLAWPLRTPFATDLWAAPSTQDLFTRVNNNQPTHWFKNASAYFYAPRPQYELYDLVADPMEQNDQAGNPAYAAVLQTLQDDVKAWQFATNDDWTLKYSHE